jgi:hypothetical protein
MAIPGGAQSSDRRAKRGARDAAVELLVSEQRRLEGQEPFGPESEIGVPQVLKRLQQQAAARQQHNRERRLDDDQRVLDPVAARARRAAPAVAESFLRRESR